MRVTYGPVLAINGDATECDRCGAHVSKARQELHTAWHTTCEVSEWVHE